MTVRFHHPKVEVTFQLVAGTAPWVENAYGEAFSPTKAVLQDYGDRCGIVIYGRSTHAMQGRSVAYNLNGYDKRPAPPDWVVDVVSAVCDELELKLGVEV